MKTTRYGCLPSRAAFLYAILIAILPVMSAAGSAADPAADPVADRAAIVVAGEARFSVLTGRLIRMEWSPGGAFEDRASLVFINRKLPVPSFRVDSSGGFLTITTDHLVLKYRAGSGKFTPENLSVSLAAAGNSVAWTPGLVDTLNLKGTTRTLDGANGAKDVTLEDGIVSRSGWALVDDSKGNLFDGSDTGWVAPRPPGERQDWYFFGHGHDFRAALHDFTQVSGKIPMPPRFAFGYWWSRYWTYSDAELRSLVAEMESFGVPIDVLIVDMDWHETFGLSGRTGARDPAGQWIGWTGYTWNRALFPDPEKFFSFVHGRGLKSALNLHPASGIAPMEERYGEFARAYGFDTTGRRYIPFAIEEKKWTRTWFDVMLRPLERQGVDFWWLDWQAWLENKIIPGLSNTWWLNHVFFTDMERRGEKRPILFHRWGGLGNHRYQIGFSGDSWSTWEALAYQPYFTATASNVGYGYWSHDIGGHVGNDPDPELYLRWLQWGVFSPIVRTHSTKSARIERRIWKYPGEFDRMRDALRLRYRLNPYIYTAAREAYDSGISICRPMYYHYPEHEEAYRHTGQYMFGEEMLVAPVTEKAQAATGLARKEVWLPEGEWFEWPSGTLLDGGRVVTRGYTTGEIPVFLRAGGIIPLYPQIERLGAVPDTLVLMVVPGSGGTGAGKVYEDDGSTGDYRGGRFAVTRFEKTTSAGGSVTVTIGPREGSFAGMRGRRSYVIEFPATLPPSSVSVNGAAYARSDEPAAGRWTYDSRQLGASIVTPPMECDSKVVVGIGWKGAGGSGSALLSGMAGALGRMPEAALIMKNEVNLRDQIANAPASVLAAAGLRSMIAYEPDRCGELVRDFRKSIPRIIRDVVEYPGGDPAALGPIVHLLSAESLVTAPPSVIIERQKASRPQTVRMSAAERGAVIRYTLDGSAPDSASAAYGGPVTLDGTTQLLARTFAPGRIAGFASAARFQLTFAKRISYEHANNPRYDGGGEMALADGRFGDAGNFREGWVGFQGDDLVADVELDSPRAVGSITLRFYRNQRNWIFLPVEVAVEVSADGKQFEQVSRIDSRAESLAETAAAGVRTFELTVGKPGISHIRIRARNAGTLPSWHPSAGEKPWVFADEIVLR